MCRSSNGGCSEFAICTKHSAGERSCTCGWGYTGDGTVCLGGSPSNTQARTLGHQRTTLALVLMSAHQHAGFIRFFLIVRFCGFAEIDGCLVNNGGCHRSAECIRTGPNTVRRCSAGNQPQLFSSAPSPPHLCAPLCRELILIVRYLMTLFDIKYNLDQPQGPGGAEIPMLSFKHSFFPTGSHQRGRVRGPVGPHGLSERKKKNISAEIPAAQSRQTNAPRVAKVHVKEKEKK